MSYVLHPHEDQGLTVTEKLTNVMAGAGITLPAWERSLDHFGTICSSLVPILSAIWIAVQIWFFVRRHKKRHVD